MGNVAAITHTPPTRTPYFWRIARKRVDLLACLVTPLTYALTRICSVEYTKSMESGFEIIAEPNRRAILSLLVSSHQPLGESERQPRISPPTRWKRQTVLPEAGLVESRGDAPRPPYRLNP